MASVTLTDLWIHNATDLSEYVRIPWGSLSVEASRRSEVRTYAGGRRRVIRGPERFRTASADLPLVPRADLAVLEDWAGSRVYVRDSKGRNIFAVFSDVSVEERRNNQRPSVRLTLEEVSGTVEV